jgi:lactate racemase
VDADIGITTGCLEPRFFAGVSGGPKPVASGLAGLDTVLTLHDAQRIGPPGATWGICEGNPVHDDVRAVVGAVGRVDFANDVVLNREQQIVKAFAGPVLEMHAEARKLTRELSMQPVPSLFVVVVATGLGFLLDQNLYQSVKGMTAAAIVVRPGGTIVCAGECLNGFPDHGSYREVLHSASSPRILLDAISTRTETIPDQWQVQILAKVQDYARVVMHTSYLSDEALATAHLEQTDDVSRTVRDALAAAGPNAKVCVLPEGPQTIPYVLELKA